MTLQKEPWKKRLSFLAAILLAVFVLAFHWISKGDWKSSLKRSIVTKSKSPQSGTNETNHDSNQERVILPDWVQGYKIWHKRQRRRYEKEGANDVKFLIVACTKRTQCGGLSDRVRSIPYWLFLAEKTERVLLIHWNKKFKLEDFWIPPQNDALDWRLSKEWTTQSPFQNSCLQKPTKILPEFHDESNHESIMDALESSERVVCVKTRADLTPLVYESFGTNASAPVVVSKVYQFLFTNTETLQEYIDRIKVEQIGLNVNEEYLAAHIRALYPLKTDHSGMVWPTWNEHSAMIERWALNAVDSVIAAYKTYNSNTNASVPPIYIASDSADVVDYILTRYNTTRVVGLQKSLPRHHLELDTANNSAYDMFPTFFDLSMISHAKCLSFGIGSYGRLGARISQMYHSA